MNNHTNHTDDRESVCSVCHRSESRAGKMLTLPGGISICLDCLQNTMDHIGDSGIDFSSLGGFNPFIGMPIPGFPFGATPGTEPDEPGESEELEELPEDMTVTLSNDDQTGEAPTEDEEAPAPDESAEAAGPASPEAPGDLASTSAPGTRGPGEKEKEKTPAARPSVQRRTDPAAYQEALNRARDRREQMKTKQRVPNISFINLSDIQNGFGRKQQVKRKNPSERKEPLIDPSRILPPHKLKARLDEYVVGQEQAKKAISVSVYNHYKRILAGDRFKDDDVEIEKSNLLLIGPTGCGKTYIVKTLARLLDVPLAITDATSLTEAGYVGEDVENILLKINYSFIQIDTKN